MISTRKPDLVCSQLTLKSAGFFRHKFPTPFRRFTFTFGYWWLNQLNCNVLYDFRFYYFATKYNVRPICLAVSQKRLSHSSDSSLLGPFSLLYQMCKDFLRSVDIILLTGFSCANTVFTSILLHSRLIIINTFLYPIFNIIFLFFFVQFSNT